jgi:hypothetical protein
MIKNKNLVVLFYGIVIGLSVIALSKCSKYQVVSELDVHLYHLHNPKNKKVEIIITEQKLEVGKFYRLRTIKTIDLEK